MCACVRACLMYGCNPNAPNVVDAEGEEAVEAGPCRGGGRGGKPRTWRKGWRKEPWSGQSL